MQGRELPRIVTAEAQVREVTLDEEHPRRSRFARLDFVRTTRRLDWLRLALTCLLVGAVVASFGYLSRMAVRSAVAWLHTQPKYQVAFTEIQLDPPAPDWIRGGNRTVLQSVLKNSGEEKVLSVPALESGRLTEAFKKCPWVREVESVRFSFPNQVVVRLHFRKPVATIKPVAQKMIVLDEDGVILPDEEIDTERAAISFNACRGEDCLILLVRWGQELPKDRSPGTKWKTSPIDSEPTEADRQVYAAARLAGYLKRVHQETRPQPKALGIYKIFVNEADPDKRGLVIYNFESARILWGAAPGEEPLGALTADEKWGMLKEWAQLLPRPVLPKSEDYWVFQKDGVKQVSPTTASNR